MEINVIGRRQDWPGNPGLMAEENIRFLELPKLRARPVRLFKFFRKAKKCMILYWIEDRETERALSLIPRSPFLSWVLRAIRLIIKKPGGPVIIVNAREGSQRLKNIADLCAADGKTHQDLIKEAYFLAECGHPSAIYDEPRQRERIDWLKSNCRGKLLEIGCATGFVLDYVGGGVGVDVDPFRLEYAKRTYPRSRFLTADAARMPFQDHEYDTVLIPDILEHVEQPHAQEILNEAIRVGKRLLVTVPNAGKKDYDKDLVENPEHKWFPTSRIMTSMLGDHAVISLSRQEDFIYILLDSQ